MLPPLMKSLAHGARQRACPGILLIALDEIVSLGSCYELISSGELSFTSHSKPKGTCLQDQFQVHRSLLVATCAATRKKCTTGKKEIWKPK